MLEVKQTDTFRRRERSLKDLRARAAIAARVFRLANGLTGDVAPVGEGISELRIHFGPGYRVYFRRQGETLILLLGGGDKQSQRRDIEMAKRLALRWEG